MAFKLRSGNKTTFKQIGSTKETNAEYNARVKAEYEARKSALFKWSSDVKNFLNLAL